MNNPKRRSLLFRDGCVCVCVKGEIEEGEVNLKLIDKIIYM